MTTAANDSNERVCGNPACGSGWWGAKHANPVRLPPRQPGRAGRPSIYCSPACRQAHFQARKAEREQAAARQAIQRRSEARTRQLVAAIEAQLHGTRLSLTQQKELSVRIAGIAIGVLRQQELGD